MQEIKTVNVTNAAEDAMGTFNKQWYNTLRAALKAARFPMNPDQLQVVQGATSLGYEDSQIWSMFDAIPPESINHLFDQMQYNSLAQDYGGVINNLIPQNDDSVRKVLGSKYNDWIKYETDGNNWKDLPDDVKNDPEKALLYVFKKWGIKNLDQDTYKASLTVMSQEDIITVAMGQWAEANKKYAYTAGATDLRYALREGGHDVRITLDSKTASSNTSSSWAKDNVSVEYSFFSAKASGQWDKFTQDIASYGLKMDITFHTVCILNGDPYGIPLHHYLDPDYFTPWWNSSALKTAKDNNDNKIWKHGDPTWEQTFGPEGNLRWLTVAIIVADGIKTTITSKASISKEEDYQKIAAAVQGGFWPFFHAEDQEGIRNQISFNMDDGTFTIESFSEERNPKIIGVLVDPIDEILAKSP